MLLMAPPNRRPNAGMPSTGVRELTPKKDASVRKSASTIRPIFREILKFMLRIAPRRRRRGFSYPAL